MKKWMKRIILPIGLACAVLGIILLLTVFTLPAEAVSAASPAQGEGPSDDECLVCHQNEGMTANIGGQAIPITIDTNKFSASVHGEEKVACVDCHTNIASFPHPEVTAASARDFSLEMYPTCQQ